MKKDIFEEQEPNVAFKILEFLKDPADLVRASSVSQYWRQLVIGSGIFKRLCLGELSQLSQISRIESTNLNVESGHCSRLANFQRDHSAYGPLFELILKAKESPVICPINAVSASSTNAYPSESIHQTLFPGKKSYWCSNGHVDPKEPEMLTYALCAKLSIVSQINIQPFRVFWNPKRPVYSARYVRFRMGTYTSPEFPMKQDRFLQQFKLPKPVLCIGGILKIELLGRVQRAEHNQQFYISICHVEVVGQPLSPAFEIHQQSEELLLIYHPELLQSTLGRCL